MKKFIFAVFIGFWASVGTVAVLEVLTPTPETPASAAGEPERFSLREVAAHDTLQDCWMVIEGQVYDFTDYVPNHPAPPSVLEPWCGTVATEGMQTKGIGRNHSPPAWALLDDYRIGELADQ
ncbi:MAG: cytochrome b5 domain-containing protein [Wenzhouxiangella sp.]